MLCCGQAEAAEPWQCPGPACVTVLWLGLGALLSQVHSEQQNSKWGTLNFGVLFVFAYAFLLWLPSEALPVITCTKQSAGESGAYTERPKHWIRMSVSFP